MESLASKPGGIPDDAIALGDPALPGGIFRVEADEHMPVDSIGDYGSDSNSEYDSNSTDDPSYEMSEDDLEPPVSPIGKLKKRKLIEDKVSEAGIDKPVRRLTAKAPKLLSRASKLQLRRSMLIGTEDKRRKRQKVQPRKAIRSVLKNKTTNRVDMANIGSLGRSNAFLDASANLGLAAQPKSTKTRKVDALREMLASIPEEYRAVSRIDSKAVDVASKVYGHGLVKADGEGGWRMRGMRSSLSHFQLLGATLMYTRERGDSKPYGGLNADEMGFGKTVMMIATMVGNPPPPGSSTKTTLIVATPSLVTQWESEIKKHGEEDIFDIVVRYHSGSRITNRKLLRCADVIITTYWEVLKSYPKNEPPAHLKSEEEKKAWWEHEFKKKGILHDMTFYRVILDEAHMIKNHTSRTSIACRALMGKLRWAISGTPILNHVQELYPYFSFLEIEESSSLNAFKRKYCCQNRATANEKLHTILKEFMIRRTHEDRLFGVPLITLPSNSRSTITVDFNEVERAIYDVFKKGFIKTINDYVRQGTLERMYQNVLTMSLRLRQLTAHIFLVQQDIRTHISAKHLTTLEKSLTAEAQLDNTQIEMLEQLRKLLLERRNPCWSHSDPLPSSEETSGGAADLAGQFALCLRKLKAKKRWEELKDRKLCQECHGVPENAMVTDCMHVYCKECLTSLSETAAHSGLPHTACRKCGLFFGQCGSCEGLPELGGDISTAKRRGRGQKVEPSMTESLEFVEAHGRILSSAKIQAAKAQIFEWRNDAPKDKIIIFTQFRMIMAIFARICAQEGWGFCEYNGGMSHQERSKSLENFRDDSQKTILIASLKCGGVGLNLTMASRVISIDLWWNSSVEDQAFCRVFRLGQERETHVKRFIVSNTIDQRLMEMQALKKTQIVAALGDGGASGKLTPRELISLFGKLVKGEDGTELIAEEDEDTESEDIGGKAEDVRPLPSVVSSAGGGDAESVLPPCT
ncbi:MAG: hypothetical protein M1840_004919 [Geoglossum simile]|nr:MAG: hypothetical protein M1840_004919 [Geoglossum simile]